MKIIILILCLSAALLADFSGVGDVGEILATPSFDATADSMLQIALAHLAIKPYELTYRKDYAGRDSFRLALVDTLMSDPMKVPTVSDSFAMVAWQSRTSLLPIVQLAAKELNDTLLVMPIVPASKRIRWWKNKLRGGGLKSDFVGRLAYFCACAETAKTLFKSAMDTLPESVRMGYLRDAAESWLDDEDNPDSSSYQYLIDVYEPSLIDSIEEISSKRLLRYAAIIPWHRVYVAYATFAAGWDTLHSYLADTTVTLPQIKGTRTVRGMDGKAVLYLSKTPLGRVVIGGTGRNVYRKNFGLVVDLGGNDRYEGATATAIGYLDRFFSAVIDITGDDTYYGRDFFSQCSSVFGIALLADLAGDDTYRGGRYAQGSAEFGLAIMWDDAGNDIYRAGDHSQAAATFGISLLQSGGDGDDSYRAYRYAQGFGSVLSFAILRELGGDDNYFAGGQYLDDPLHPEHYMSMSQGFGFGWRSSASGGVGFLFDAKGNDEYYTQVYGQGASYWYAFGLLYDVTGHDAYQLYHYGQGAGIHLSVGSLIDRKGEDSYIAYHAPCQGSAHDWAVGVMIDDGGMDTYNIPDGNGWGFSIANAFSLFLDRSGPDLYAVGNSSQGFGSAHTARGYGGLAIFLDLGGKDTYPANSGENNRIWVRDFWGVGVDADVIKEIGGN